MARIDTPVSIAMHSTNGLESGDVHGRISVELSGHNKRKRDQLDEGQDALAGQENQDATKDPISTNGLETRAPTSPLESVCSESATKRSRLTEDSPGVLQADLVVEEAQRPFAKVASLPIEIWQNIFCFVPPVFLGRLLRVSHTFNSLLTPNVFVETSRQEPSIGAAEYQTPIEIWAASRKRFCPGLPKPVHGLNDLDMWRLLRGSDCQLCGEKKILLTSSNASNQHESGPGNAGVRVIWPFGVRSCGPCLMTNSEKVVSEVHK